MIIMGFCVHLFSLCLVVREGPGRPSDLKGQLTLRFSVTEVSTFLEPSPAYCCCGILVLKREGQLIYKGPRVMALSNLFSAVTLC